MFESILHAAGHHLVKEIVEKGKENGGCGCVTVIFVAIAGLIAYLVF